MPETTWVTTVSDPRFGEITHEGVTHHVTLKPNALNRNSISAAVIIKNSPIKNTVEFTFEWSKEANLLGDDLYVEFWCVKNMARHYDELIKNPQHVRELGDQQIHAFQFGYNSYFHWRDGIERNPEQYCFASSGLLSQSGPEFNDVILEIPQSLNVNWKEVTPVRIRLDRFRAELWIKGRSIPLINQGSVQNKIPDSFWEKGYDGIVMAASVLGDNREGYTVRSPNWGGKTRVELPLDSLEPYLYGSFGCGHYVYECPGIPVKLRQGWTGERLPWMKEYDRVMDVIEASYYRFKGIKERDYYFRDRLLFENGAYPYPPAPHTRWKDVLADDILGAKHQGKCDLVTAILMGATPVPDRGSAWTGIPNPEDARNEAIRILKAIESIPLAFPNKFVIHCLLNFGRHDMAVHGRYILPHTLLHVLGHGFDLISASEKPWVPDPRLATPTVAKYHLSRFVFVTN